MPGKNLNDDEERKELRKGITSVTDEYSSEKEKNIYV